MSDPTAEIFVANALRIGALELIPEGRKLKSGRKSPYFFNSGKYDNGRDSGTLVREYAACAHKMSTTHQFDVVYGPAYKGITLAFGTALFLDLAHQRVVEWAHNRKESKAHGEGGRIVGASLEGKRVLIVDDVITTGGSCEEAVKEILGAGGTPVGCVIGFDRMETVSSEQQESAIYAFSQNYRIPVCPVATLEDLIAVLERDEKYEEDLERIRDYRKRYGIK